MERGGHFLSQMLDILQITVLTYVTTQTYRKTTVVKVLYMNV